MSLRATRAEINIDAFCHNIAEIKRYIGFDKKVCLALKANAYGHGSVNIAKYAKEVDFFAVACIDEAIKLRDNNILKPILILSPFLKIEIELLFEYDLIPIITHLEFLDEFERCAEKFQKSLPIHVKVNTGMNRVGFDYKNITSVLEKIHNISFLTLAGICTHFASSDGKDDDSQRITQDQLSLFQTLVQNMKQKYGNHLIVHAANSGGVISYPDSYFDMVRVGLAAYGYPYRTSVNLKPVMNLKSKIVFTKKIQKGEFVSYGASWRASENTNIALLPIGYGDGIFRSLSNTGFVKIDDKYFPIVGKICMDLMMIDTGDEEFPLEKDVLIFGNDPNLNAETLGTQCDTISYEIMTKITDRVPRKYIHSL